MSAEHHPWLAAATLEDAVFLSLGKPAPGPMPPIPVLPTSQDALARAKAAARGSSGLARSRRLSAAKLSTPILVTALLLGFGISLFQSVTQIQEATLSFVPKAVGVAVALLVSGNWMLHEMVTFTTGLYNEIPKLLGAG